MQRLSGRYISQKGRSDDFVTSSDAKSKTGYQNWQSSRNGVLERAFSKYGPSSLQSESVNQQLKSLSSSVIDNQSSDLRHRSDKFIIFIVIHVVY